jgi:hypothetical protein
MDRVDSLTLSKKWKSEREEELKRGQCLNVEEMKSEKVKERTALKGRKGE